MVAAVVLGVFVFGSIWSVQAYENVTNGDIARTYIANARSAVQLAPPHTPVFDVAVPNDILEGLFGPFTKESRVIGDDVSAKLDKKLIWITKPRGTIDGLRMFGPTASCSRRRWSVRASLPATDHGCWPASTGRSPCSCSGLRRSTPAFCGSGTSGLDSSWADRRAVRLDRSDAHGQARAALGLSGGHRSGQPDHRAEPEPRARSASATPRLATSPRIPPARPFRPSRTSPPAFGSYILTIVIVGNYGGA